MRCIVAFSTACFLLAALVCQEARAQFRGRDRSDGEQSGEGERRFGEGGRFGGFGGGEGRFGGGGGGFRWDPSEMVNRMDRNGNGVIDADEMQGPGGRMIVGMAERAGLDPSQPMRVDRLVEAMSQGGQEGDRRRGDEGDRRRSDEGDRRRSGDERRDSNRSASRQPAMKPLVPGFGLEQDLAPPPGFDIPLGSELASALPLDKQYPDSVLDEVNGTFRRYDRDENGILEGEEMNRVPWRDDPRESDVNKDGRISRVEFAARVAKQRNITPNTAPGRISFVTTQARTPPAASTGGTESESDRLRRFAESFLNQNDADKSGKLEEAAGEWENLRSDRRAADTNGDKVITLDELTANFASYSDGSSGSGGPFESRSGFSRFGSRGGSSSKPAEVKNGSGRLLTPQERLPKGLPDWFLTKDKNEDGQISMAEYALEWSDSKVAEFAKYDRDGDGFVVPSECLKAEKK